MSDTYDRAGSSSRRRRGFSTTGYLRNLSVAYQRLWANQLTSWDAIREKMDDKDYTTGQWVADVTRMYECWWEDTWLFGFPFSRWIQGGDRIPSLAFVVDFAAQAAGAKEVLLPLGVNPDLDPEIVAIRPVKRTGGLLPEHLDAAITEDATHLRVALQNIQNPAIEPDHYDCLVCVPDEKEMVPIATVHVVRLPEPPLPKSRAQRGE